MVAWSRSITELAPLLYEQATATSAIVKQIESDKRRKVWPALRWSQWRCATVVCLTEPCQTMCAHNLSQARKKRQHAHQSDSDSDEDSDAGDSDDSASSTEVTR